MVMGAGVDSRLQCLKHGMLSTKMKIISHAKRELKEGKEGGLLLVVVL